MLKSTAVVISPAKSQWKGCKPYGQFGGFIYRIVAYILSGGFFSRGRHLSKIRLLMSSAALHTCPDSRHRIPINISRNRLARRNWHSACQPLGALLASSRSCSERAADEQSAYSMRQSSSASLSCDRSLLARPVSPQRQHEWPSVLHRILRNPTNRLLHRSRSH
jgi:hypothetical protein